MKKKKKRKVPPPDPDNEAPHLVASNVDPSLLVRVPHDNRVNVEGVLDHKAQLEVEQWSRHDLSIPVETPMDVRWDITKNSLVGSGSQSNVGGDSVKECLVAPKSGIHMDNAFLARIPADVVTETVEALKDKSSGTIGSARHQSIASSTSSGGSQLVPLAGECLVFKAGSSGSGLVSKSAGSNGRKAKTAGVKMQHARRAFSRDSGGCLGTASASSCPNPPTIQSSRPETGVPGSVPAGPPKGAQVRPSFSDVIKDNRLVGNGFKLEHYDLMENEDDVVLDESDEIPFVETWGYCLIGFFTGPFPSRQALNSLVNSWNVKCRIIPYAKGWTVFRFMSDEDRFKVFNGGPYLAFGKTLMLRLVDAGVIIGDDLFTSVPT
ncbi:hypothetical protein LIER_27005 [Lithospermum erythrorhizon]|uniref:DUF4283 domain-containing protein n=1 Tax=Lithospermum erythrorhizon TaxID=34254 RepID=A0AAV3RBP0_LITER